MYADPRTIAFTRIVIGTLLVLDCIRHWVEAERYYSNDGVLTNHWLLFRPSSDFNFSLFSSFSTPEEVHVAFGASLICYFLFAVGYKSRLFNVLSLIWVTSMDNRLLLIENGGYVVVNLITFWLCFMPTGQRFSVDSLRRSYRERKPGTLEELSTPDSALWLTARRHSLAAFLLLLNFGIIYIFNTVNKYGDTWRYGHTLHYVLHLDRMVTGLAVWCREVLPYWFLWFGTHLVLVVEATIVMSIFWPRNRRFTRPVAMVLVFLLHLAFGTMMRLGPFSWFMIGWSTVLLMPVHWEAMERWYRRRVEPVEVRIDTRSGLSWTVARLLTRLDRAELLSYVAGDDFMSARVGGSGEIVRGNAAWWAIARALPAGKWAAPILRVLSLGALDAVFFALRRWPKGWSRFFGLSAPDDDAPWSPAIDAPSSVQIRLRRYSRRLREIVLVWMLLCATSQLINENKSIPEPIKHKQPWLMRISLQYLRIFQGWGMFSPNPIRKDGVVAVDAVLVTGEHIDPFSGEPPDLDLSDERGCGLNQVHQDYFNRIRLDRNQRYRRPMEEWFKKRHILSGNPDDEIVFYNVWWLTDKNPAPGKTEPTEHEKICLASWRKPGARLPKGASPLPKTCKVKSAGK